MRTTVLAETSYPRNCVSIAPSDSADLVNDMIIICDGAGNVRVDTAGGQTQTLIATAGVAIPVRVKRVYATSTTATGIKGFF